MAVPYLSYKLSILVDDALSLANRIRELEGVSVELVGDAELHLQDLTELAGFLKETINREHDNGRANNSCCIKTPD